jgi:hypothetical protein
LEREGKSRKKILQIKSSRLLERQEELYRKASKRVKRLACSDKREATDQLAAKAEEVAVRGEQGKMYKITKGMCGEYKGNTEGPVKDKQGLLWTERARREMDRTLLHSTKQIII